MRLCSAQLAFYLNQREFMLDLSEETIKVLMNPKENIFGGNLVSAKMKIYFFYGIHHSDFLAWALQDSFSENSFGKFSPRYDCYSFNTRGSNFIEDELIRIVCRTSF